MSLDPAFLELRTKPLPTLPERRRLVRERLAKTQTTLDQLTKRAASGAYYTPKGAKAAKRVIRKASWEVYQLTKALEYLGEPHPRLDLYRTFGLDLPKDEIPE